MEPGRDDREELAHRELGFIWRESPLWSPVVTTGKRSYHTLEKPLTSPPLWSPVVTTGKS